MPQTSTEEYVSKTYQSPVAVKRWLHQKRFTDALRLLELRPGQTVLDYGTGDGHFLEVAAQQHDAALLFGYEPAEELFVQAKKKLNQTGVTVASELGKLGRKQFDKIVGMEVCEHLPERNWGSCSRPFSITWRRAARFSSACPSSRACPRWPRTHSGISSIAIRDTTDSPGRSISGRFWGGRYHEAMRGFRDCGTCTRTLGSIFGNLSAGLPGGLLFGRGIVRRRIFWEAG